jgi:hypothetical protein
MYKNIYKNIKQNISKKESFITSLWKTESTHPIYDKKPHFIFSSENPKYPSKVQMSHDETLEFLAQKGYKAEGMEGMYGTKEKSILVHNPPKSSYKHLNNFAASLGQESSIISDGYKHEMHYINGDKAGRHHKGESTVFHKDQPEDYYSTLADGSHFTHGFDFEDTHKKSDFIKDVAGKMKKSEVYIRNNYFHLKKSEDKKHPFETAGPDTKLIHYSPEQGLEEIDPNFQGKRKIGSESKQGAPEHKMAFYYAEGIQPEDVVTSGSKSKYVTNLGDKKLYDIAKDPNDLYQTAMDKLTAKHGEQIMPYMRQPAFHAEIKNSGFSGIYNSGLPSDMSRAVGMFETVKPDSEHPIHLEDFKETSAKDHHALEEEKNKAKEYADDNGHPNHEFLHNLNERFKKQ